MMKKDKKKTKLVYISTFLILLILFPLVSFIFYLLYFIFFNPKSISQPIPSNKNNINLINKLYKPNPFLFQDRGYKGTWAYNKDDKYYRYNQNDYYGTYNNLTKTEQNLTNAFLSTADNKNLSFYKQKIFNSLEELFFFTSGCKKIFKRTNK